MNPMNKKPERAKAENDAGGSNHNCGSSASVICIHLQDTGVWWGVPGGGDQLDWMCSKCIKKFGTGDGPDLDEIVAVCASCVREQQICANLFYPIVKGDGSWSYDESIRGHHGR